MIERASVKRSPAETAASRRGLGLPAALFVAGAAACVSGAPPVPPADVGWRTYSNEAVGYEIDVPEPYAVEEEEGGRAVLFRWRGTVPVKVYLADGTMARSRGLWAGHEPSGAAELGGRPGRLYDYRHCDGPFCSRMKSYVVEHRGLMLGLEFRAEGELHAINRQILRSFRFREGPGAQGAPTGR